VGLTDGGGALSADGVIIAIRTISSELPIRNRPILFIIFPPLCQRIFRAESSTADSRRLAVLVIVIDLRATCLAIHPIDQD